MPDTNNTNSRPQGTTTINNRGTHITCVIKVSGDKCQRQPQGEEIAFLKISPIITQLMMPSIAEPPISSGSKRPLLSCCSIALRELPVSSAIEVIAKAGFRGVEIWFPHIQHLSNSELREVADRCMHLDLSVPVIAPYFSFTRGAEMLRNSLKTAETVLGAAEILRSEKVRTFIDIGRDGLASREAEPHHWKSATEGLKQLCALDTSRQFVVETHENTLADSLPSARRIVEEVTAPNLKINFQSNRDFLSRGYIPCLSALYPAVSHLHLQQIRADASETYVEEEGQIDFHEVLAWLRNHHYAESLSVEYCWTPVEAARLSSAFTFLTDQTGKQR